MTLALDHDHPHPHDALRVEGLTFRYPDGTRALDGLTLSVREGDALGIVGPNGAGKSTLLLHLVGVHLAQAGRVAVGGEEVTRATLAMTRRRVGLVFQNPDDQLFMPTVLDDVAFGPLHMGLPEAEARRRALDALAQTGTAHLADRPPYHLSGGEKRAVAIATVLSMEPQVLVLDEPSAGLDPRQRRALVELLRGLRPTRIVVSHDLELVLETCRRVAILDEGRIVAEGPAETILADEALLRAHGLERPHGVLHRHGGGGGPAIPRAPARGAALARSILDGEIEVAPSSPPSMDPPQAPRVGSAPGR